MKVGLSVSAVVDNCYRSQCITPRLFLPAPGSDGSCDGQSPSDESDGPAPSSAKSAGMVSVQHAGMTGAGPAGFPAAARIIT